MTGASTPCIKVCVIDPASGLCEGCGRRLDEIAQWSSLSEAERLAIMAELPERLREREPAIEAERPQFVIASAAKQSRRTG
ncbi:DUF1289 domain-containing protein [Bosea sp. SSUT16]|jgi:predicted Fe-S protein YdhL (DUF1289 family)|uniref:DUF1289 domain-containing protein n=1 Tax=Bosea spartocytisi TaxID=2773451 RepID=A0A927HWG5_9HYPH|nr:DUF1289 domain-containing protein [Bosea spartocytisi]MBD3844330.1 DUF1289 domain-containing protein [Bosea spartocytisi]MCT4470564.1 DUF1289 domain-containing protein [Bosea spartocytisi]